MAKGLRSKSKRRNRTEFRNTIGKDAAAKSMDTVQQKLQECISKGSLNSFERLSNILGGNSNDSDSDMEGNSGNGGVKTSSTTATTIIGKNPDRIPTAKKTIVEKSRIRGPKKGRKVRLRTSAKKKVKDM
mmetsp:Transcript_23994/g.30210  ORF Transcript_23994/g.30210 Transcript_23994/m.30210 type:complete len:130 (+) Transcript_23994:147-536(+)|eukprot:CAMPEP_0203633892 /NCGR_PEP_ID=MMETSP0088-20131115/972_1 /ASSEMBLY_ACC=CAM_ASM_001087 /TAXON_ID=426623 /ORGANISM="Chaetoceros affinis, Strain CCMP159" /LENGTH=129 /DNA_ID=CAMNT_0050487377 /DNA_START=76 /DNA_END=465 /DNA_ORIENTATION=+